MEDNKEAAIVEIRELLEIIQADGLGYHEAKGKLDCVRSAVTAYIEDGPSRISMFGVSMVRVREGKVQRGDILRLCVSGRPITFRMAVSSVGDTAKDYSVYRAEAYTCWDREGEDN